MNDLVEIYIYDNINLDIIAVKRPTSYTINLDEETNAKSDISIQKIDNIKKGYFVKIIGLFKELLFIIDEISIEKESNTINLICKDISNIFDRKIIKSNLEFLESSIEEFVQETINTDFVNSDDPLLNISYINTVITTSNVVNAIFDDQDGIYNFHTFITNLRQNYNIFMEYSIENGSLNIEILYKNLDDIFIDTNVSEVINYNKVYDVDPISKVTILCGEDNSKTEYFLLNNRSTTTDKNNVNRVNGRIDTKYTDKIDKKEEEALNIFKGNRYTHLVEFDIYNKSKLVDITNIQIGTPIQIKTDSILNSYISAMQITNSSNFTKFKSGNIRINLIDKLKQKKDIGKNKLDKTGGIISGNLKIDGILQVNEENIFNILWPIGRGFIDTTNTDYSNYLGFTWQKFCVGKTPVGKDGTTEFHDIGQTGGEKTHILTVAESANHSHTIGANYTASTAHAHYANDSVVATGINGGSAAGNPTVSSSGGGGAHNNLPPYEVVNFWKRIA